MKKTPSKVAQNSSNLYCPDCPNGPNRRIPAPKCGLLTNCILNWGAKHIHKTMRFNDRIYLLSQPTFFSYLGAGYQLPKVQAESLVLIDSKVKLDPFTFRVHVDEPSLTFKVKLINSNVTWKLIFFLSCKLYCKLFFLLFHVCTRRLFCYTIAVSLKVILLFVCAV